MKLYLLTLYEMSGQCVHKLIYTVELVQYYTWVFSDILWHLTKIYSPKVFLLTKVKPEYFDILYNPTHLPGLFVCQIRQVPLYICILMLVYISLENWETR